MTAFTVGAQDRNFDWCQFLAPAMKAVAQGSPQAAGESRRREAVLDLLLETTTTGYLGLGSHPAAAGHHTQGCGGLPQEAMSSACTHLTLNSTEGCAMARSQRADCPMGKEADKFGSNGKLVFHTSGLQYRE
ncbi:hypothetical protein ABBQ38_014849 [Trebouxia sp. C0009 RCD-2024]